MFKFFESLIDSYPKSSPATPPKDLGSFLWSMSEGYRLYFIILTVLTAMIGAFEAILFGMLADITNWLAYSPTKSFFYEQKGEISTLVILAIFTLLILTILTFFFILFEIIFFVKSDIVIIKFALE